jgi:hypothetical protein
MWSIRMQWRSAQASSAPLMYSGPLSQRINTQGETDSAVTCSRLESDEAARNNRI